TIFAAKLLAAPPMRAPRTIYNFLANIYEWILSVALRLKWLTLAASLAAVGVGIVLFFGIPNWQAKQEEGKPPPEPLVKGLQTGLMPAMDEGAFVLDYWAPSGTPLARTAEMVREVVAHILSASPAVPAYVRRSGA